VCNIVLWQRSTTLQLSNAPTFSLPPRPQVEKLARTLFLWKIKVHEQKEKVYEMRRWNEALVTNMLPEHVARHFLGSKKRDEVVNPPRVYRSPIILSAVVVYMDK